MNAFSVKTTNSGMQGIELYQGNLEHHELLRNMVTTPWKDHPAYPLRTASGAFLQGQTDQKGHEWTLVEFWQKDGVQAFVDFLNEKARELKEK